MQDRQINLDEEKARKLSLMLIEKIMDRAAGKSISEPDRDMQDLMKTEAFEELAGIAQMDAEILRSGWKSAFGV